MEIKKLISKALKSLLVVSLIITNSNFVRKVNAANGSGTESDPYVIEITNGKISDKELCDELKTLWPNTGRATVFYNSSNMSDVINSADEAQKDRTEGVYQIYYTSLSQFRIKSLGYIKFVNISSSTTINLKNPSDNGYTVDYNFGKNTLNQLDDIKASIFNNVIAGSEPEGITKDNFTVEFEVLSIIGTQYSPLSVDSDYLSVFGDNSTEKIIIKYGDATTEPITITLVESRPQTSISLENSNITLDIRDLVKANNDDASLVEAIVNRINTSINASMNISGLTPSNDIASVVNANLAAIKAGYFEQALTVTYSYATDANYLGSSATATVTLINIPNTNTLEINNDNNSGTVVITPTVNENVLLGEKEYVITVTPNEGMLIKDILLSDGTNVITPTFDKGVATFTFVTTEDKNYVLTVTYDEVSLSLKNHTFVFNGFNTLKLTKEELFNNVFATEGYEWLTANDVTIYVNDVEMTSDLTFVDGASYEVKLVYAGLTSNIAVITMEDGRATSEITVNNNVEVDVRRKELADVIAEIISKVNPTINVNAEIVNNVSAVLNATTLPTDNGSATVEVTFSFAGDANSKPAETKTVTVTLTNKVRTNTIEILGDDTNKGKVSVSDLSNGVIPGLKVITVSADPVVNKNNQYYVTSLVVKKDGVAVSSAVSYANGVATVTFTSEEEAHYVVEVAYATYFDLDGSLVIEEFNDDEGAYTLDQLNAMALQALLGADYATVVNGIGSFTSIQYKSAGLDLLGTSYENLSFNPSGFGASAYHRFGTNDTETVRYTFTSTNAMYKSFEVTKDVKIVLSKLTVKFEYNFVDELKNASVYLMPFNPFDILSNVLSLDDIKTLTEGEEIKLLEDTTYYVVVSVLDPNVYTEAVTGIPTPENYKPQFINIDIKGYGLTGIVYEFTTVADASYDMQIDLEIAKLVANEDLTLNYNPFTGKVITLGIYNITDQFLFDFIVDMENTKPGNKDLYVLGENTTITYELPTLADFVNSETYEMTVKIERAKDDFYPAISEEFTVTLKDVRTSTTITYNELNEAISFVNEDELLNLLKEELAPQLFAGNKQLSSSDIKIDYVGQYDSVTGKMVAINVTLSYADNENYRGTSVTIEGILVDDIPENVNIKINSEHGTAILENQVANNGIYVVMGNGTYKVIVTPNKGYAIESITVDCLADELEAIELPVDYLKQVGTTSYLFNELVESEIKNYVVTVNYVESKLVFKDELKVPYKVGYDLFVPSNETIYNSVVANPDLTTDAVVTLPDNQKITITYKAREAGKYTVSIPPIKLFGIEIYKGGEYEVELNELWFEPGTEVVETDVELLIDEFITTITSTTNILDAYNLFNELINETLPNIQIGAHEFGAYGDGSEEIIHISYEDDKWLTAEEEITVVIYDDRATTTLSGSNTTVVYGQYTETSLLEMMNLVVNSNGNVVETTVSDFTVVTNRVTTLNASEEAYEVVVRFKGNAEYQPSETTINVTVNKAPSAIDYDSQVVVWGSDFDFSLKTDPVGLECFEIMIGIDLHELSEDNLMPNGFIEIRIPTEFQTILKLLGLDGKELSLNEFIETLNDISGMGDDLLESLGITSEVLNILVTSIQSIVDMMEETGGLTLKFTNDINPTEVGVYLAFAISYDSNYETSYTVDYLVITPKTTQAELDFNMDDTNGLISANLIKDGYFDLGANATIDNEVHKEASDSIGHLFVKVDTNGEFHAVHMFDNGDLKDYKEELSQVGGYVQLSYLLEWGNELFYAVPIIRAYAVVPELVKVDIVDKDGNIINELHTEYDGQPLDELFVKVYDNLGDELSHEFLTVTYYGYSLNNPTEIYNSTVAPTNAGIYTAVAFYNDGITPAYGANVCLITIKPIEATIDVVDGTVTYKDDYYFEINTTPEEDMNIITIVGGIKSEGTFLEEGLFDSIDGFVNIDLPEWLEVIVKDYLPEGYEDGIKLDVFNKYKDQLKDKVTPTLEKLGLDYSIVDEIFNAIEKFNNGQIDLTLTFKDKAEMMPVHVGVYGVIGIVCDNNFVPAVDAGYVIVKPAHMSAEIEYNTMITEPIPYGDKVDLSASAFEILEDGTRGDKIGAQWLESVYVKVDSDIFDSKCVLELLNNVEDVMLTEPTEIGTYVQITQLAGLDDIVFDADFVYRVFTIRKRVTGIEITGLDNLIYTSNSIKPVVTVFDADKTEDNALDVEVEYRYEKLNPETGEFEYVGETHPTNVGTYRLTVTYVGDDVYVGSTNTVEFTIEKANVIITLDDKTVVYGNEVPTFTGSVEGVLGNDDLDVKFVSIHTENVGEYVIFATYTENENYNVTVETGTLTITPKELTVILSDITVTYGDEITLNGCKVEGLLSTDKGAVEVVFDEVEIKDAGVYENAITATVTLNSSNYVIKEVVNGTLTINKKDVTVSVNYETITYGDELPVFNSTIVGLVYDDTLDITYTCDTDGTVGVYPIEATVTENANYNVTVSNGKLTINPKELTNEDVEIDIETPYVTYNGLAQTPEVEVTFGETVLNKGTDYTVEYSNNTNAGTATVTITFTGNYSGTATTTFTINKKDVIVSVNNEAIIYGQTTPEFDSAIVGLVNGDTLDITYSCDTDGTVGTYEIEATVVENTNYNVTVSNGTLTINKKDVLVSVNNVTITYGTELPKFDSTIVGLVNGDTLNITYSCDTNGNAGTYDIVATVTENANYNVTVVNGTLTITELITSEDYIFGIEEKTSVESMIETLKANGTLAYFVDANGEEITTGTVGTGMKFQVTIGNVVYTRTVVIMGDVDGDGSIRPMDFKVIKNQIMGETDEQLAGAFKVAANLYDDNYINAVDYTAIRNHIMAIGDDELVNDLIVQNDYEDTDKFPISFEK